MCQAIAGHAEFELLHQFGLGGEATAAERGQCAGGAAELADQNAGAQFVQALAVPRESGEQRRHFVAEGDRHRLLQVAAAGHRRVAVFARERGERAGNAVEMPLDQDERLADLHHRGGISDVLGGGAPVAPFAEPIAAQTDKLLHDRQYRIADALGLTFQFAKIDLGDVAMPADLLGGLFGDDAEPRLGARQSRFEIEIFLQPVFIRKHAAHGFGREDVAKNRRVDQ